MHCKTYTILKYPKEVKIGWLSKITNIPNTICTINLSPTDNNLLLKNISRGLSENQRSVDTIKDEILRLRTEIEIEDAEKLIHNMYVNGDIIAYMTIVIMVMAETEEELQARCKKVEGILLSMQMKIRAVANLTEQAYNTITPFNRADETIKQIADRNVPVSSFVGGLPFASSGFNDNKGYYFSQDMDGGIVVLDTWKREGDRTNSNFVIMGTSGVGKSTVAKHLMLNEFMIGTKIITIDVEREYKELTHNLDGDWLNVGGGRGGIINPLEIKDVPLDEEDEEIKMYVDEGRGLGAMALHFQTLRTFFKLLFPELTSVQIALLEETLEELYNSFNIYWETDISNFKNTDFPIMKDLYELITIKMNKNKEEFKKEDYMILQSLIRTIAIGADSALFNGYTSVKTSTKYICLDTHNLQDASERVKKAQYFNILSYCWQIMSEDREERTMLFCDEAYLLIDSQVPQSLIFLRNISKRCRKYESALCIISHSVVDFLDDSIRRYGQSIVETTAYKVLMGTDGKNLEETTELFKLSDYQADFLYAKKRGFGIFIIGAYKIIVKFDLFPYEFEFFGKGGGR